MSHGQDLKSHLSLGDADEPRASGSHEVFDLIMLLFGSVCNSVGSSLTSAYL